MKRENQKEKHKELEMNKILDWIKEVREGSQKTIRIDLEKVMNDFKRGNYDKSSFAGLVQEIRDNERDDALLCLIEEMIKEELSPTPQSDKIGEKK